MKKLEKGQLIIALILVMTIALAIGLSIVQKSLVDISTATKTEQSSRAFSAAEAGIENTLNGDNSPVNFSNSASAVVADSNYQPSRQSGTQLQSPIEFPPLSKEDVVQVWLSDPGASLPVCNSADSPALITCYKKDSLDVYWGDGSLFSGVPDYPALELTLIYYDLVNSKYNTVRWYLDNQSANEPTSRVSNSFEKVLCNTNPQPISGVADSASYLCRYHLVFSGQKGVSSDRSKANPILIRARLLYNQNSQPLAFQANGTDGVDSSLPAQVRIIKSTGTSGQTKRQVQLFQSLKVVPHYFDYAIFSSGDIQK